MLKIILDIPPSVNHCYVNVPRKGRRLTEAAKNWKLIAGYEATQAKRKQGWVYPAKDETEGKRLVSNAAERREDDGQCR